jgi:MFS transporter, YNFM family, putative membrane transport protein
VFTMLRIAQGLCMASAFALTLAYLGEQCSAMDAGGAFAAYITGNVASNLVGRLVSAAVADTLGLASNFYFFALLNLAGAVLVYFTIKRVQPMHAMPAVQLPFAATLAHWRNPQLRAAFAIGFCILFAFIGTFTFVNFVLVRAPLSLGMMDLGLVYLVFAPSVVTTLFAGKAVAWFGTRPMIWAALALAAIGLVLMLSSHLADVLAGMVLVGVGTFFAQACATGFVGQAAQDNRGVASGTYLACYFLGGLAGSAVLGQVFDRFGWTACVIGIAASLVVAAALTVRLRP